MVALPQTITTVDKIYDSYTAKQKKDPARPHLGASEIGKDCERAIWYNFRWVGTPEFKPNVLRLFDTGRLEENRFVNDLQAAGVEIYPFDLATGRQFSFSLLGGHFGGSFDGYGRGFVEAPATWHLTEFKTHNEKSFNKLVKEGVRRAKPEHFAQMQCYMGMTHERGQKQIPKLKRAYYLAVNKNNDQLHGERLEYEPKFYAGMKVKASRIVFSQNPLPRIATVKEAFVCRFCDHKDLCFAVPEESFPTPRMNCRTCCHVTPKEDGTWVCEKHNKTLSKDEQLLGCGKHLYLPQLLPWEVIDADDEANIIAYDDGNGSTILNKGGGRFEEWKK